LGHLVNATAIGKLLGISRQRVDQLVEDPSFPNPISVLGRSWVWEQQAIVQWAESTGRDVIQWDERPTVIILRPPMPEGSNPTTEPAFVVHLVDETSDLSFCGIAVDRKARGEAGFASIDDRNRCAECARLGGTIASVQQEAKHAMGHTGRVQRAGER